MFSGVSDGESPSESQDDIWVLRDDEKDKAEVETPPDEDSVPVTGVVVARPQMVCRPMVVSNPQYVLARVETHSNPSPCQPCQQPQPPQPPPSVHHKLPSPMSAAAMPIAAASPRKMAAIAAPGSCAASSATFPRVCPVPPVAPVRPPPPPPPPRTTPVVSAAGVGPVRPSNPALQRPSLQQRGNFHESPDEGYHEDDGGSETL